jgi:hypothetical protein
VGARPAPGLTFADVRKIAQSLDGIDVGTAYDSPCLRVNKTMIACIAINKEAEPNSLMVRVPLDQRDALIAEEPGVYYLKPHYEPYPCVLVRLGKVHRDALRDLLHGAWQRASVKKPRHPARAGGARRARTDQPATRR